MVHLTTIFIEETKKKKMWELGMLKLVVDIY